MREILFRGKHKDSGKWVEGVPYFENNQCFMITDLFICEEYQCTGAENVEVISETVGQYTGLNDKNGKRIFEGDVVKAYDETYDNGFAEVKGKVFFNCGSFDIDVEDVGYIPLYSYGTENIEVIDNIHDNGDLLKGE